VKQINWRSLLAAIFSTLTILAALPYDLGNQATIIPPELKPKVVIIGLISTIILRIWNSIVPKQTEPKTGV
jgi:hypothetical protein